MKRWIWVLITIVLAVLTFFSLAFVRMMFTVVKYGTPHYRPRVG